jgi:DNA-binding Lrp family transcriptional regulator
MSKQALFYYAENLHLVQKATFTDATGRERGLAENGRDLLVFLCNATNEKQGFVFHMGYQYIAEETGIHINTVKRLLAGLEQLGWITRTGVVVRHMGRGAPSIEYELTFYTRSIAQNMRTGSQTSSHMATDNLAKGKPSKEAVTELGLETEPKPKPEPKTQVTSDLVGQEWGQEHELLLADCVATDLRLHPVKHDRGQIVPHLQKQYRPIVARAMKERPTTDLVGWCYQVRNGEAPAPATTVKSTQGDKYDPTCTTCDKGLVIVRDKTYPGSFDTEWCACTERTTLRLVNE